MNDAEASPLKVDERVRAALLWDRPALLVRDDVGCRQWRDALELQFVDFGDVAGSDTLSLAAHVVYAAMSGDRARIIELRGALRAGGGIGELFDRLLGLGLTLDDVEADRVALAAARVLVGDLADADLRARLLVRLVAFAELRGARDLSRAAAQDAVANTSATTRLGVVARRWAGQFGIEVPNFNSWAVTDTPEDPLLALPWVQRAVIEASAAMAAERFEQQLAGVWDSTFHVGRTRFDELLATHAQAEWCGALGLRSDVRKLLSTDILTGGAGTADQVRWGLLVWATEPSAKRVSAAVRRAERELGASDAAELMAAVRRAPNIVDDARIQVAAGVWDLLDDSAADDLLNWLLKADVDRSAARRNHVVSALLWRRPASWAEAFADADQTARTQMLAALDPGDLAAAPDDLRQLLATHEATAPHGSIPQSLAAALRFVATGLPITNAEQIDAPDVLELLDWNSNAVTPELVGAVTAKMTTAARERLNEAAQGKFGFGSYDTGQLLGCLASYLPRRPADVIDTLLATCRHADAPAAWQFGALEGLFALRRVGHVSPDDVSVVRDLRLAPRRELFGQEISAAAMRANQLRVLVPEIDADDVAWLAVCGRGSDVKARLVAMVAFGAISDAEGITADWSLVGGLFDPDDDVVVSAIGSIGQRGVSAASGARLIVRERLFELAVSATAAARREVVMIAAKRPELELADVVVRARQDRAWTVRREADASPSTDHVAGG